MQGSYIGNTTASQAVKAGSTPVPCSRKETSFVYRTNGVSFQLNPPFRMDEISSDDEIPYGDEIRLDGGWVDLISSALADFIRVLLGFHRALRDFIENR